VAWRQGWTDCEIVGKESLTLTVAVAGVAVMLKQAISRQ